MKRNELLAYLKQVSELEAEIHAQEAARNGISEYANGLCRKVDIHRDNIEDVVLKEHYWKGYFGRLGQCIGAGVLCAVYLLVVLIILAIGSCAGCVEMSRDFEPFRDLASTIGLLIPLSPVLFLLGGIGYDIYEIVKIQQENKKLCVQKRNMDSEADWRYKKAQDEESRRLEKEGRLAFQCHDGIDSIDKNLKWLRFELKRLYARDIIYPTYRNYIAVTQMYEYIASGVCDKLEGKEEAYAQYLNDIRAQRICSSVQQLEEAVKQGFAQVVANQNMISNQIRQTNALLHSINTSLNVIGQELSSIHSTLDRLVVQGCAANEYLNGINEQLGKIADSTDRAAFNTAVAELNRRRERCQKGLNTFWDQYPA